MTKSTLFLILLVAALAGTAHAQTLETGTWTGYIVPPNSGRVDVTYGVTTEGDTLKVAIIHEEIGTVPFTELQLDEEKMTFNWIVPGAALSCELFLKANGGYEGECAPENGESGMMVMNRPVRND